MYYPNLDNRDYSINYAHIAGVFVYHYGNDKVFDIFDNKIFYYSKEYIPFMKELYLQMNDFAVLRR